MIRAMKQVRKDYHRDEVRTCVSALWTHRCGVSEKCVKFISCNLIRKNFVHGVLLYILLWISMIYEALQCDQESSDGDRA